MCWESGFTITIQLCNQLLACEQALQGALAVGQEKEGELATTSLAFEYLHQKSRCKMLIGRDDIRNDVITLGMCFSMFVYICAHFHFALTGRNLTAQQMGATGELDVEFKFQRCSCKLSFLFPPCYLNTQESLSTGQQLVDPITWQRAVMWIIRGIDGSLIVKHFIHFYFPSLLSARLICFYYCLDVQLLFCFIICRSIC